MSTSHLRPFEDLGTAVRDSWARRKCAWLRPPLAALVAECGYLGMRGSGHRVRPRIYERGPFWECGRLAAGGDGFGWFWQ